MVSQISYGSNVRTLTYDGRHQLTGDTVKTSSGATVASAAYGYDADGHLTSLNTTGLAGAASNTYTYDQAGRVTSWNNGTTTTNYGYDSNGNLTQNGSKAYTYDARDELTSDGTNSYGYTARGTLASQSSPAGTVTSSFDAFGDQVSQGPETYVTDGLGRMTSATDSTSGSAYAAALEAEAARRGQILDQTAADLLAERLPAPGARRRLTFAGIGSSTTGRNAADADEMLAEGFGRDC